jgi:hypothetical protein
LAEFAISDSHKIAVQDELEAFVYAHGAVVLRQLLAVGHEKPDLFNLGRLAREA